MNRLLADGEERKSDHMKHGAASETAQTILPSCNVCEDGYASRSRGMASVLDNSSRNRVDFRRMDSWLVAQVAPSSFPRST
jgi:hypothetical protein